ncbi:MAG: glycine/sarcosine/betaine reductase selenoprotein B family protein [Actinomycetota bacterium]
MSEMIEGASEHPPADYIAETRRLYSSLGYDDYRWAERTEAPAFVPLTTPLSEARVCLIGSGAVYETGQVAFHSKDDTSVRVIASDVDTNRLRTAHFAYDQTDAREDINCVFPLDRMNELAADGVIGEVAEEAYSFMGGIYSIRRTEEIVGPRLVELVTEQAPDVVLLVPV